MTYNVFSGTLNPTHFTYQETAPRKTTENTVKHCVAGVGSMVANHRGGGEILMVVS